MYAAVKPRRFAFSTTSVSLTRGTSTTLLIVPALVALDTKLLGVDCLSHVGREGRSLRSQPRCCYKETENGGLTNWSNTAQGQDLPHG